ncbi:hypothetical protein [Acinetobacter sp.]|uniref:hypothetical protein n=1 Tax=Acinetobacter sp. TaxID=472 RepID=UPI003D00C2BE
MSNKEQEKDGNPNYICTYCGKDLSNAVKLFGGHIWEYHKQLHETELRSLEIKRLRAGLISLRDGGYGCDKEAQRILDDAPDFQETTDNWVVMLKE